MNKKFLLTAFSLFSCALINAQDFKLGEKGYFSNYGVDVMAFDDIYPEGHQGGVSIIMHGHRIATNGDIRLEHTPGQWQPVPKQRNRTVDEKNNEIVSYMSYPDSSRHMVGFNPMIYPDLHFNYTVRVKGEGNSVRVTVDLDRPIPAEYAGKVGFNMELFPGTLFGKSWLMDGQSGIFPRQPNGPTQQWDSNIDKAWDNNKMKKTPGDIADFNKLARKDGYNPIIADDIVSEPYAIGKSFTVCPEDEYSRFTIVSEKSDLKLYDGRMNHNNGWFVVHCDIPAGATTAAVSWVITPNVEKDWVYSPVIQTSQVGYHPSQSKVAVIELDKRDMEIKTAQLFRLGKNGREKVADIKPERWGNFLRYNYLKCDFTGIKDEGMYQIQYGDSQSTLFRIAKDVYDRGVWQPVLEYFLPVQMCHMRVNEKYRVWHDFCHLDDARMAPALNHIDGYRQDDNTRTKYKPGDFVPGLNRGGWHDAGDFDLRVESQSGESYILALAHEAFGVDYDATSIDQNKLVTEIHQPDGKSDLLQQVEHGALSVVGGYRALGRLYRGIICNDLRQYVLLGDAGSMTDNVKGNDDDRWVFTEDNPPRELTTAAHLAAVSRVLKGFNDTLSVQSLDVARELFKVTREDNKSTSAKIHAAVELYLTTGEDVYKSYILSKQDYIVENIDRVAWFLGRADKAMADAKFSKAIRKALVEYSKRIEEQGAETPYGIPYRPHIWGAGWGIQSFGFNQYFLNKSYPDLFKSDYIFNALNFVLGCHPGSNTASFASGVGAVSATVGYGLNRADWSYIPGGVISGTALIRPDFPELLTFPFLWQQTEYVLGGGSSHYMFLVLAAQQLLK